MRDTILNIAFMVTATVYNPTMNQTDSTPLITASGAIINPGNPQKWIAVSRDLEKFFPFDTKVEVCGVGDLEGVYVVKDRMNKRFTNRIDILVKDRKLGKWEEATIKKLGEFD